MASKTFVGIEEIFEVIHEVRTNLSNLMVVGFNMASSILAQGWAGYFAMLYGPIYPILVKEFWKYVFVSINEKSIYSHVFGYPIVITPTSIAQAIGCFDPCGITVEHFNLKYTFFRISSISTTFPLPNISPQTVPRHILMPKFGSPF